MIGGYNNVKILLLLSVCATVPVLEASCPFVSTLVTCNIVSWGFLTNRVTESRLDVSALLSRCAFIIITYLSFLPTACQGRKLSVSHTLDGNFYVR